MGCRHSADWRDISFIGRIYVFCIALLIYNYSKKYLLLHLWSITRSINSPRVISVNWNITCKTRELLLRPWAKSREVVGRVETGGKERDTETAFGARLTARLLQKPDWKTGRSLEKNRENELCDLLVTPCDRVTPRSWASSSSSSANCTLLGLSSPLPRMRWVPSSRTETRSGTPVARFCCLFTCFLIFHLSGTLPMNTHPENDTLTLTPKMTRNTFATNTEQFIPNQCRGNDHHDICGRDI